MKKILAMALALLFAAALFTGCSKKAESPSEPNANDCDVTRSVSKTTEIERRGGKRWDKPKKAGKSRDCRGGKF